MKKISSVLAPALILSACSDAPNIPVENAEVEEPETAPVIAEAAELSTIDVGIAVGEMAPVEAQFKTAEGEVALGDVVKDGPAVLVFTRSVEWCPFCQTQLKAINGVVEDLKQRGYLLYGVSYDSTDSQDRFSKNQMLEYGMLSDETSSAIDAFGLRDPQYTEGKAMGVPYASVVVIGKDGKIIAKSVSGDYKKRPTNDQLLSIVDAI